MPNESLKFIVNRRITEKQERAFLFVSAHPDEGKTFTSRQVADLLLDYFIDEKIALADFDIVNPELSRQLGNPATGWSNANLRPGTSKDTSGWLYDHPCPDRRNLFYVPLGNQQAARLGSVETAKSIPSVIHTLKNHFGLVLIDGPAVLQTSATLNMATSADGVFLVVEAGRTRRQVVELALDQLREAGANIIGVIMNKRRFFIPAWLYSKLF
jgi:Mrp family chromosome partitioning ATPase